MKIYERKHADNKKRLVRIAGRMMSPRREIDRDWDAKGSFGKMTGREVNGIDGNV